MFGYITPFKPQLKMCEMEVYKSVYCGLCKNLSRFGVHNKMLLSYDMTFYLLIALSIQSKDPRTENFKCFLNPLKTKVCVADGTSLELASDLSVVLFYYKLKDNVNDEKFLKKILSFLGTFIFGVSKKKAVNHTPQVLEIVKYMHQSQEKIEKDEFKGVDQSCDPFAKALEQLFCLIEVEKSVVPIIKRVGYMTGRFVYLMDALDDLEDDFKNEGFNPILKKFGVTKQEELKETNVIKYASDMINLTIAQLASAYELLPIRRYKPILDNIIYLGLKCRLKRLIDEKGVKTLNEDKVDMKNTKEILDGKFI